MTNRLRTFIFYFLALLLIAYPQISFSQTSNTRTDEEEKKELKKKALTLLGTTVEQAKQLNFIGNRVLLSLQAADALWPHDKDRARVIYREVSADFQNYVSANIYNSSNATRDDQLRNRLRETILQSLSARDVKMALEFFEATKKGTKSVADEQENNMLLRLAANATESDSGLAVSLAKKSLANGLSYGLPELLSVLAEKDQKAAAELAKEIEPLLLKNSPKADDNKTYVIFRLAQIDETLAAKNDGNAKRERLFKEETFRKVITEYVEEALKTSDSNQSSLYTLNNENALIKRYASKYEVAIQKKVEGLNNAKDPRTKMIEELQPVLAGNDVDAMLREAPKVPDELRGWLYQSAIMKAAETGDFERAKLLANDHISDPDQRKQLLEQAEQTRFQKAVEQNKIQEGYDALSGLTSAEAKANLLIAAAYSLIAKDQKEDGLRLLNDAQNLLSYKAKNMTQLSAQMQIAGCYLKVEQSRGFEIMERLATQINSMVGAARVLSGFVESEEAFVDDEFSTLSGSGTVNDLFTSYTNELKGFAESDFDKAKALADQFQDNETQTMAKMAVVNAVLSAETNRNNNEIITRNIRLTHMGPGELR